MTTQGEKPRRWQFSLRGLLMAVLVVGVGLGLFVRWWRTPVVAVFWKHENGVVGYEEWQHRDWRRGLLPGKTIARYSTGQKCAESVVPHSQFSWWLPDGTATTGEIALRALLRDNGDGTFREPEGP